MRLARTYEEVRGRDLEGFLGFLRDQEALGAAQLEAVSEEEGAGAMRLLTIHAAKGLEFKVVVVADAGRDLGGAPPADEILALADGRFGFKVDAPVSGERKAVFGYDEVAGAGREAARAERLRLYYVAMTRAVDRLLVSGALGESRDTPIGWVLSKLDCEEELASGDELVRAPAGRGVVPRPARPPAEPAAEPAVAEERRRRSAGAERPARALRGAADGAARRAAGGCPSSRRCRRRRVHRVRQLSYSALALFERCSYRYYAERVAGLRELRGARVGPADDGLAATEIGDAVHRLLEEVDLRDARAARRSRSCAAGTRG